MSEPLKILSLGAGLQSTTIARMSIHGELPKIDACIFADTGWERDLTYKHFERLRCELEENGIPVHKVIQGEGVRKALFDGADGARAASIPVHIKKQDGQVGMGRRQCTSEYKIKPIMLKTREILGLRHNERVPKSRGVLAYTWLGITLDEASRMKDSGKAWIKNAWPLIEIVPMTRQDCVAWNLRNGYEIPPRSACVGCPYQGGVEWSELSKSEIEDAANVERAVQQYEQWTGVPFLHRSCKPLREVDLRSDYQKGQLSLFDDECSGMCGV